MTESCGEKSPDTEAYRDVTSVGTVEEADATDRVKEIYGDIKTTLGIDFVPNMYRATAKDPSYLDVTWKKIKSIMNVGESWIERRRTS